LVVHISIYQLGLIKFSQSFGDSFAFLGVFFMLLGVF